MLFGAKSLHLKKSADRKCPDCGVLTDLYADLNSYGIVDQYRWICHKHGQVYRIYQASRAQADGENFIHKTARLMGIRGDLLRRSN